jgi:hypothetical protein
MVECTIRILQRDSNLLNFTKFIFLYLHFEHLFRIYALSCRASDLVYKSVLMHTQMFCVVNVASMAQLRGKCNAP